MERVRGSSVKGSSEDAPLIAQVRPASRAAPEGLVPNVHNSPRMAAQRKKLNSLFGYTVQRAPNEAMPVQRRITGVTDVETFNLARDEPVAPMLHPFIQAVILEDQDYTVAEGLERAMELAMVALDDDIETITVTIRLADLLPNLDPDQHKPALVRFDAQTRKITQDPLENDGGNNYRQESLAKIALEQDRPADERTEVVPIFFENIPEDHNQSITTGDGRHRIATYAAMGVTWIPAEMTPNQRARLEARGIEVQDG